MKILQVILWLISTLLTIFYKKLIFHNTKDTRILFIYLLPNFTALKNQ